MNQITEDVYVQKKFIIMNKNQEKENDNLIKTKFKSIIYKSTIILSIYILACLVFINSVYATTINSANIYSIGDCGELLKYKGIVVKVSYVQYISNGNEYPAYCLDKTKPGVESVPYMVSVKEMINDVGLWRRIVNGYPYKSIQELGVNSKQEAFTATKQAIYCYIHGNNPNDYEAIGEAGERTLNAMKQIIESSEKSNETKISNNIKINKGEDNWKQDEIDKNYLSKEFSILEQSEINNYKVKITHENKIDLGGIKVTNLHNEEKDEFIANEKFKVLIPIKNLTESGSIKINIEAKMKTKPVLYGMAPDTYYQDYALTAETYEDSKGESNDYYSKNETKIIIIKQDTETKETLEGVEFEVLDKNKNVVYTGLKTNQEGKIVIENLIPDKYFIKEVNSRNGYEIYEELVETEVSLHEQVTVNMYNNKEKKPNIEINKKEKSKEVKKLPITGM